MLRVNAINRQKLLKCLTFNPKSLVFKTVSVPATRHHSALQKESLPADDSDSFSFGVEVFTLPHTVPSHRACHSVTFYLITTFLPLIM